MMNSRHLKIEKPFIKLQRLLVMVTGQTCPFVLLVAALLFQNCTSDNKKAAQPPPPANTTTPNPQEPSAPAAPHSTEPQEKKESPVGKSVEELRKNKSGRIGTVPTGKDAELNSTVPAPPTKVTGKSAPKAGPPGYITQKDIILQAEPAPDAPKISTLKQYEIVYILETIMKDEQGRLTQYPTWYKVERENKQRGWVVARGVNAGAGG